MERAEFLSGLVWRNRGEDDDTNKEMVHIKEECKRGRARHRNHGERNVMEAGKKEGKWGVREGFTREDGRKRIMRKGGIR